jgi:small-conductance mechanosensitive channel
MVVEEMNISTTTFLGSENRKIIIPNNILATKVIQNFLCSPDMKGYIDLFIHVATSNNKI